MKKVISVDVEKLEKINSVEKLEKMTLAQINKAVEGVYVFGKTTKSFVKLSSLIWKLPKSSAIEIIVARVEELFDAIDKNGGNTELVASEYFRVTYNCYKGYIKNEPDEVYHSIININNKRKC